MPTYVVTAPQGRLTLQQKKWIGAAITNAHCTVTGAPAYFAQVIFNDVQEGNYFVGGKILKGTDHVYVHGQIRAGRDIAIKEQLLLRIMHAVAEAANLEFYCVQVYIVDVPARQIAEYGQILPLPGEEEAWWEALPPRLRERLETIGI